MKHESPWPTFKVGDLCSLMTGGTPSRGKPEYFDGEIKWLVSGDIHQGQIRDCMGRISEAGLANSNARLLPKGSVMIALNGQGKTRGTVAMLRTSATCNQSLVSIEPKDRAKLLPEFLFANLQGRYDEIRRMTGDDGNDRRGLNMRLIKGIEIPLPPLEEQKRIVAVLDQAFAALDRARALAEANLADVSTLRGQYLDDQIAELFAGFGSIKVNEIASVKGGKRLPKGQKTANDVTPYPYISVRDMTDDGTVDTASVQYISKTNHEAIKRYTISSSDIYVSIAGTIGKTGVVPAELHGANLTENAAKLVLRTGWDRDFVYWWTRSGSFSDQAIEQTRTAAQPKLALERLGAIKLPNADLNNQKALVACMERMRGSVRSLTDSYTGKLSELRDLRQSLLQKAFAGELT